MTDMVVSVVLKADGSGLVGQVRLGAQAVADLTRAQKEASAAAKELTSAEQANAMASREAASAAKADADASENAARKKKELDEANKRATKSLGAQRYVAQQVSNQLQDIIVQGQMGTSVFVILSQQGSQLASALALLGNDAEKGKGKFAAFASFLGGPWGAALTVAITLAGALGTALMKNSEAADAAKIGSSGLSDAQGVLSDMFDLSNGKIKKQNELLLLNARLTQLNLKAEAAQARASASQTFDTSSSMSYVQRARGIAGAFLPNGIGNLVAGDYYGARDDQKMVQALESGRQAAMRLSGNDRAKALDALLKKSDSVDFTGLRVTKEQYQQAIIDAATADAKDKIAAELGKTIDTGTLSSVFLKPDKPKKKKTDHEAQQLASFGDREAEAVARINDEYNTAPRDIDRARQATAQLDMVIADVNRKMTTAKNLTAEQRDKFEAIKKSARDLKPLIQESLVRPITDLLKGQQQQIDLGAAQLTGRQSEVDALQLTQQLMGKLGVQSQDQLATELARRGVTGDQVKQLYSNLAVMREQTRELQKQQAEQQAYLNALGSAETVIRNTLADMPSRGAKAIGDMFQGMVATANSLFSDVIFEQIFGGTFSDLRDQITGANKGSTAGEKLAAAVDNARASMDKAGGAFSSSLGKADTAVADFADAVSGATAKLGGRPSAASAASSSTVSANGEDGQPITVIGHQLKDSFRSGYESVFKDFKSDLKSVFTGIFGEHSIFQTSLARTLGTGLANAQMGTIVGKGVTDALGLSGSSTGGALGGALGGAAGKALFGSLGSFAGPLGTVAGGIIGSVVGGLFKKTYYGTATISGNSSSDVSVSANKGSYSTGATSAASSVQEGLAQIADAFNGSVGGYKVSIGQYDGKWRVSTTGYSGKLNYKGDTSASGKGLYNFDGDASAAIAFAIANAISDGAIEGVSEKVAQALKSSTDINQAIAEAQKVQSVETLLGGVTAEIEQQFRTFEAQAKERVRIANEYGFDVVAIEKKNAEERAALVDQILSSSVGDLQSLLKDIAYGGLYEGTAVDQRQALLNEIADVQAKALAGEDGAASTLATLQRQLLELSKDAFGTAGTQYASDRASVVNSAQAVIDAENERIKAAQAATEQTNSLLDTANGLAETGNGLTADTNDLLAEIAANIKAAGATAAVARVY